MPVNEIHRKRQALRTFWEKTFPDNPLPQFKAMSGDSFDLWPQAKREDFYGSIPELICMELQHSDHWYQHSDNWRLEASTLRVNQQIKDGNYTPTKQFPIEWKIQKQEEYIRDFVDFLSPKDIALLLFPFFRREINDFFRPTTSEIQAEI